MSTMQIHLLGDFRLILAGTLVTTIVQARMQSLLAYLLLHREAPHLRQRIAFLFWPDSSEDQALTNLRQLLHQLRRCLPECDKFLQIETKTLQWRPDAAYTLDVADFEQYLSQATTAAAEGHYVLERMRLESAIRYYGGDLLNGFYEDWILPERERLSQAYSGALQRLVALVEEQHDYQLAIRYAEHLLRHDRLNETTYRGLMRLHELNGDRASALRVYHSCVTALTSELGVEPNIATQEAYHHLLNLKTPSDFHAPSIFMSETRINLVGRLQEWNILHKTWRYAASGQATFVVISGEAGIGKTRLAEEFLEWAAQQGAKTARTRSYAAKGQLPYASVIELLRANPLLVRLSTLDHVWRKELVRLMPELSVDHPDLPKPEPISDPRQRLRLFEALARAVFSEHEKPLVLMFDDLQWCDQDTLEWLRYLLHFDTGARLLIVGGVRPEELVQAHPLNSLLLDLHVREQIIEIELAPLDANDTAALAEQASGKRLTAEQAAQLYHYTEGNLLFVIETIRAEMSGNRFRPTFEYKSQIADQEALSSTKMPSKIEAVIQFRLRQLSPQARDLVSHAACIGRAFSSGVLEQASGVNEEALVRGLDELWQRRIVREQGGDVYDFTHDRIREVAYNQIPPARRKLLHRRVASALEKIHMAGPDAVSGQIAIHYERAGKYAGAISYYQRAAGVAKRTFSNAEVIDLINRAIAVLPLLPDTAERRRTELNMLITLGTAQMLVRGVGQSEAAQTFLRAWDLYQSQHEQDEAITALAGLSLCYHLQGDHRQAQNWAEKLKLDIHPTANPLFHTIIQATLTGAALFSGDFFAAEQHAKQGFASEQPHQDRSQMASLGFDPVLTILGYWSLTLWLLGYPDQARTKVKEALPLADIFRQPVDRGYISSMNSIVHQLRGDVALTLEQAAATMEYARENGLDQWVNHGRILYGWALAQGGQVDDGYVQIRRGITAWKSAGAWLALTYYLLLLAETCTLSGQIEEGLSVVTQTLDIVHAGGESWMHAELYRRKGELLLRQGADDEHVEICYQQALEIARLQQARSLELRAAMSLSRLWQRQGKHTEARNMLGEIYECFSEGFESADLREAKKLLEVLH